MPGVGGHILATVEMVGGCLSTGRDEILICRHQIEPQTEGLIIPALIPCAPPDPGGEEAGPSL